MDITSGSDQNADTMGHFYKHGLILIPAWISNDIQYKVGV